MNRFSFLLSASILFTAILIAGCESNRTRADAPGSPTDTEAVHIPFRNDGTLTFLRGEQEIVTIDVEIAQTDSARERGLMQRKSLPAKSGMLFIFDRPEVQTFWMANTPLPLDMFFVNTDSVIVNVARYTRPYSSDEVSSIDPALYVVEVPAGFADNYGITESNQVRWEMR
ncbi:MAG TPA: DUF192 domain-containing protein [Rhodothermales bacterium]|nr:DUF192 domain-containing protein [Rhodothermales bacterium]